MNTIQCDTLVELRVHAAQQCMRLGMTLGHRGSETQAAVQVRNMLEQGGEEEVEADGAALSAITVATLDAELEPLILSKAAQHGLAPAWITRLARLDPRRRQVPQPLAPCLSSQQLHTAGWARNVFYTHSLCSALHQLL